MPGTAAAGPYATAAGQVGSTAIYKDNTLFTGWATGYLNYLAGTDVTASWQTPEKGLGKAAGISTDIVCPGQRRFDHAHL